MTIGWNLLVLNWQLPYKNLLDGQFPWVIYNRQSYCSYNHIHNGCRSGYIFKTDQIDRSKWETQFYQNGNIRFGLFQFESHKNAEFEQKMMSLEETIDRDREFTHVLNKQKLRFFHKSTLSINDFCNSEQFDSICLDLCLPACRVNIIPR